jgi:hypothetical protein
MHGKNPTREQRKLIEKWHLTTSDWLVQKDTPDIMQLIHRYSDKVKVIPKGAKV